MKIYRAQTTVKFFALALMLQGCVSISGTSLILSLEEDGDDVGPTVLSYADVVGTLTLPANQTINTEYGPNVTGAPTISYSILPLTGLLASTRQ